MASAIFDEKIEEKKPTVQVGDPFTEKLLLEACLELMAGESIIAIQDMGAAGLTSSSIEMASKGKLGIELDLSKVPCREDKMTPYEIMLSESIISYGVIFSSLHGTLLRSNSIPNFPFDAISTLEEVNPAAPMS